MSSDPSHPNHRSKGAPPPAPKRSAPPPPQFQRAPLPPQATPLRQPSAAGGGPMQGQGNKPPMFAQTQQSAMPVVPSEDEQTIMFGGQGTPPPALTQAKQASASAFQAQNQPQMRPNTPQAAPTWNSAREAQQGQASAATTPEWNTAPTHSPPQTNTSKKKKSPSVPSTDSRTKALYLVVGTLSLLSLSVAVFIFLNI